ncbi:MAG: GIY-YIG nuclease family protein [Candidatus Bathyarchaeota archaeon]|nr:GIY-YIG nuclease family protein [Candidatus Termiticorpusculum sp.]
MKGIYVLIIKINTTINPQIGALGEIVFPAGTYAYIGSAQNNIESRIKRHLRKEKHQFWHIDYLLTNPATKIIQVYYLTNDKTYECQTAQMINKHSKPIPNFGCSDCHCNSHLFHADNFTFLKKHLKTLPLTNINP